MIRHVRVALPDGRPGDRVVFSCSADSEVDKGNGLRTFVRRGVLVAYEYAAEPGIEPPGAFAWRLVSP